MKFVCILKPNGTVIHQPFKTEQDAKNFISNFNSENAEILKISDTKLTAAQISASVATYISEVESDIPRPNIFVTDEKPPMEKKVSDHSDMYSKFHFMHLYTFYTKEEINNPDGTYKCYNCQRDIGPSSQRIWFYPISIRGQDTLWNPTPHCRPGCSYRTVMDLSGDNTDIINTFSITYGVGVVCAPPRMFLFVKGGLTLEEYHKKMNDGIIMNCEPWFVRPFVFSPTFIGSQVIRDGKDTEKIFKEMERMRQEESRRSVFTIVGSDGGSKRNIEELPMPKESKTIAEIFKLESFCKG
jgi:hypothetical protein